MIPDKKDIIAEAATTGKERKTISVQSSPFYWYALYTRPRAEKQVHLRIMEMDIETFLPLYKTIRMWSDRKKIVEKPLFSSYVFVKANHSQYHKVLKVAGAVKFISFEGKAVAIPEKQILNLKILIDSDFQIEVTGDRFEKGDNIEVTHGALVGLTGELIRIKRKNKVVVRIDRIDQNLIVDIPAAYIRKL
jgi:transcription antitermination factor NusG